MIKKSRLTTGVEVLLLVSVFFSVLFVPNAIGTVGYSDNGILEERWRLDMHYYSWGHFGSSPAIADLGPDVNNNGTEPDSDLEIATGNIGTITGN
jgi:hypothetical protein